MQNVHIPAPLRAQPSVYLGTLSGGVTPEAVTFTDVMKRAILGCKHEDDTLPVAEGVTWTTWTWDEEGHQFIHRMYRQSASMVDIAEWMQAQCARGRNPGAPFAVSFRCAKDPKPLHSPTHTHNHEP